MTGKSAELQQTPEGQSAICVFTEARKLLHYMLKPPSSMRNALLEQIIAKREALSMTVDSMPQVKGKKKKERDAKLSLERLYLMDNGTTKWFKGNICATGK
ncbi:hypothetical protein CAPTEDRAFT_208099 [Capitella teleta]|uniref:Uncharacterized protein n=1 Tax=Capitella teleta TaxID=283909 RepID=R7TMJ3_CAPTE|nr:hypothetical protein CAPTEDRAFT_205304 [Capitella teleta]ELU05089.1 hypothetical protein CAPTEDRAFT_208099 [Capitella teleta]|eukprot:ELT94752.1 hypothetical protein CAPTEDRAFT_205304 [Capitella teleta]